jgi:cytochrome P450
VRSFLSASVDTTVNGVAHMMLAFATFPREWEKLRERPALARGVFDESLRWDSTVQTFFRTTTRDATVAGVTIPDESKVLLFLAAANRDPRHADACTLDSLDGSGRPPTQQHLTCDRVPAGRSGPCLKECDG